MQCCSCARYAAELRIAACPLRRGQSMPLLDVVGVLLTVAASACAG